MGIAVAEFRCQPVTAVTARGLPAVIIWTSIFLV
jgi:hypothetical protein